MTGSGPELVAAAGVVVVVVVVVGVPGACKHQGIQIGTEK